MIDDMLTTIAALIIYMALAMIALMQERHWMSVMSRHVAQYSAPEGRRRWQRCAVLGITAGLMLCVAAHGPGFGIILWLLLLTLGALAVTFTLAWQPQRLRRLAKLMSP